MKDIRFTKAFFYTQQSLSTFDSCPLKFRKRYMEGLRWDNPDIKSKAAVERGNNFHLLAHRYFLGIYSSVSKTVNDHEILNRWILNLAGFFKMDSDASYLPEYTLRAEKEGLRLEANFDLLIVRDGMIEIWDWKTQNRPSAEGVENTGNKLEKSLQTIVYLYTLKEKASVITGKEQGCETLSMNYWQPDPPRVIARVDYDSQMHRRFGTVLHQKITAIEGYDWQMFDKTLYSKHCRYCEFNWYCNKPV